MITGVDKICLLRRVNQRDVIIIERGKTNLFRSLIVCITRQSVNEFSYSKLAKTNLVTMAPVHRDVSIWVIRGLLWRAV